MRSLIGPFVRGEFLEIPTPNPADTRWVEHPGSSLQERLEALQARWVLITHNAAHAFSVPAGTDILFRGYIPPDGAIDNDMNLVDTLTPQQWADAMSTAYHLPAGAYWSVVNEPIQRDRFDELVLWLIQAASYAWNTYGRRVVIGNFSVGWPEPEEWQSGPLANLLRYCDRERDHVVLGLHEYGLPLVSDSIPWFCGRWQFIQDACTTLGIDAPRILITEFGVGLRPTPDGGREIATWRDLGWTEAQYADWCIAVLEGAYLVPNSPVEGLLVFEYAGGDSGEYGGFDTEFAHTFWARIIADAQGREDPVPEPEPEPEPSGCLPALLGWLRQTFAHPEWR